MSRKAVDNMTQRIMAANPRMTATQARQKAVKVVTKVVRKGGK